MLTTKQGKARVHARVRGLLVAAQIGISVVLLSGASLLLESFRNLESQNLGMETRNVLTVHIPLNGERYPNGFQDIDLRLEAAFRQIPGVSAVGMSNSTPPDGWHGDMRYAEIYVTGRPHPPPGIGGSVVVRAITPDYFRVLRIPVLEGAGFTEEERQSSGDFIVLSKLLAARLFPQGGAIGQHIQLGTYAPYLTNNGPVYTVVGVAADVKNAGLAGQQDPEFYTLRTNRHPESWDNHHIFLIETQLPVPVISQWIRSEAARLDPTAPVEVSSLNQDVSRLADRPRFETALVGFFAACGVLLAIVGLYGVIAYVTTQRTHEIGVRMAIGATRMNVFWLIALDGVRLVALGGVVGLVAALLTAQSLKSMMFQVGPRDPLTYALVVASLAFVALAATVIPSYRAMKVDPAVALRYE